MAFLTKSPAGEQYRAMMQMRWRMMANSLRTRRGRFELGARIFSTVFFLALWLGVGAGLGIAAWHFATEDHLAMLSLLLWPVLVMWQMMPVMLASFQEGVNLSLLLRFPVSFRSYFFLYVLSGLFDLSSLLGGMALLGIWIGTVSARPQLAAWLAVDLALFAVFNLLLTRMVFAWLDRWLAQRRTREILGILLLFAFLGLQLLNPVYHQRAGSRMQRGSIVQAEHTAQRLQRPLPPALTAQSLRLQTHGNVYGSIVPFSGLCAYTLAAGVLLGWRLRAEYRGESLADAPSGSTSARPTRARLPDTQTADRGLLRSGPIAAVLEKELLYLKRSGVMLYGLLAPLILLFLFGGSSQALHTTVVYYALPVGVAYGFLGLTRIVGNSLGGEAAGIQLYFLSPTPFRSVMLAKNLLHLGLFTAELLIVCAIVRFRFGMPNPWMLAATMSWVMFALPLELALGNLLSIRMAYPMTLTRISREQGSIGNGLLGLAIQLVLFAVGAGVYFSLVWLGHARLVPAVFLVLAAGGVLAWLRSLQQSGVMANARRETLMATLVRTA